MGIEIERKFLVRNPSWRRSVSRSQAMDQGYLVDSGGLSSVRVRLEGDQARLNIKAAVIGSRRAEFEYPIPLIEAREILETLCVGRLRKTRHWVDFQDTTWEIDEFEADNQGLIVAEVELESENQPFDRPDWLGEEVTQESRYYNHALALQPYRKWVNAN